MLVEMRHITDIMVECGCIMDTGIPIEWNDTYQTVHFTTATNLNGFDFVDTSKLMNTNGDGMYQVHWNAVGTGTNNHIYHGAIFVNEVEQEILGHSRGDGNGEVNIAGLVCLFKLK